MPNLANPIQVVLNNIDQQPILFIPDGGQDLLLEVNNFSGQKLVFASDTDIFRMTFRPSTLVKPVPPPSGAGLIAQPPLADRGIQLVASDPKTLPANSDLLLGTQEGKNWDMTVNETGDGFVTMSFRLKQNVSRSLSPFDPNKANDSRLVLRLGNLQPAASSQGTRSTPVDVQFNVKAGDGDTRSQLAGIEKAHLTLLNLSRTAYLAEERSNAITNSRSVPFGAEFIGSNNVFNDGQPSEIHLRVRNLTDAPLQLSPGLSKVALRFRAGDDQPLDNIGLLVPVRANVTTEPLGSDGVAAPWSWDGTNHVATATADAVSWPQGAEFRIAIFIANTTRPSGYAPLSLEFTNLPDHPDGRLELLVQIGPLFIDNEEAVGMRQPLRLYANETRRATIGFDSGGSDLHIQTPGTVRISGTGTANGDLQVDQAVHAQKMALGTGAVTPAGDGDLAVQGALTVGTPKAPASLTVNGGLTTSGDLTVQGALTVGTPDAHTTLTVNGGITTSGLTLVQGATVTGLRVVSKLFELDSTSTNVVLTALLPVHGVDAREFLADSGIEFQSPVTVVAHWLTPIDNLGDFLQLLGCVTILETPESFRITPPPKGTSRLKLTILARQVKDPNGSFHAIPFKCRLMLHALVVDPSGLTVSQ